MSRARRGRPSCYRNLHIFSVTVYRVCIGQRKYSRHYIGKTVKSVYRCRRKRVKLFSSLARPYDYTAVPTFRTCPRVPNKGAMRSGSRDLPPPWLSWPCEVRSPSYLRGASGPRPRSTGRPISLRSPAISTASSAAGSNLRPISAQSPLLRCLPSDLLAHGCA